MFLFYPREEKICDHCVCKIKSNQLVAVYSNYFYLCLQCYANTRKTEDSDTEDGDGNQ